MPKRRRENSSASVDEEEQALAAKLFGDVPSFSAPDAGNGKEDALDEYAGDQDDLFVVDTSRAEVDVLDGEVHNDPEDAEKSQENGMKPVWEDEDDLNIDVDLTAVNRLRKLRKTQDETTLTGKEYSKRLRDFHNKMRGDKALKWAKLDVLGDDDDDDEEARVKSSKSLVQSASMLPGEGLPSDELRVTRKRDANQKAPSNAVVQTIDWHRNAQLMLTGGLDKKLRLFRIDGDVNARVHSVHFPDLPISQARFIGSDHSQVLCSGRRPFFYVADIESGKVKRIPRLLGRKDKSLESFEVSRDGSLAAFMCNDGYIALVSQKTKQMVSSLKMNGSVRCCSFFGTAGAATPQGLYSSGGDGVVYKWDLRMNRCMHRHKDEGSLGATSLSCTRDGSTYAVGSTSGVVNVYDAKSALLSERPAPVKAIMNVATSIDQVQFNHDGQILSLLSRREKNALRLYHVASKKVFPNWPTARTPINYASCAAFSPRSGYFAAGNDKGRVLLYRLEHFPSA